MAKTAKKKWVFASRFRRHAFGWRSQPAIKRIKEAVSEVKKAARQDPALAGEGAVLFLERVSPALERIDSSSGAIGTAVNNAIDNLVPIMVNAPADAKTREAWLERLWEAHEADQMPYIETLTDYWGDLCASREVAAAWADRLLGITRLALSPDKSVRGYFHGTSACLSALFFAERYAELVDLLEAETLWSNKYWAARALAAMGKKAEAVRCAEESRSPWASDRAIDSFCEEILLSSGLVDEAYDRYGLSANRAGTYLAWFRAVAKKYPVKSASQILSDLVAGTPGDEGKWFAAAKTAGLYDEAIGLALRSPCDPRTLSRAARDFGEKKPPFAVEAGMAALQWLVRGYGYEITGADVWSAYSNTVAAAERCDSVERTKDRIRRLIETDTSSQRFVEQILGRELGLR